MRRIGGFLQLAWITAMASRGVLSTAMTSSMRSRTQVLKDSAQVGCSLISTMLRGHLGRLECHCHRPRVTRVQGRPHQAEHFGAPLPPAFRGRGDSGLETLP